MRYGYWLPVFGGWLRNVDHEAMDASWNYVRRLATRSERLGFDVAFVPEWNVEEVKNADSPALDAWSTASALAALTRRLEFIVSALPLMHPPAAIAKQAATVDQLSGGRLSLHVTPASRPNEARRFGLPLLSEDECYRRASEWLTFIDGLWHRDRFTFDGDFYHAREAILEPKPIARPRPAVYSGADVDAARRFVARSCDGCLLRGDSVEHVTHQIVDLRRRREQAGQPPLIFAMTAFIILRDTEREARDELQRITDVKQTSVSYRRYQQWLANARRGSAGALEDFAVSHGGLQPALVGTREQISERISRFERAGISLLLVQCSPQLEEMDRFASAIIATEESDAPGASWSTTT